MTEGAWRARRRGVASMAVCGLAIVACGGSAAPVATSSMLRVDALDVEFDSAAYETRTGELQIMLEQRGLLEHSLVIEDADGVDLGIRLAVTVDRPTDTVSVDLPPGVYAIWCDIPGHRALGMESTLTVQP